MCCLTCAFYLPTEPAAHKVEREAGRCASGCGREWDWHTAFQYVKNHTGLLSGECQLNPEKVKKDSWNICGQHKPVLPNENGWGVRAFGSSAHDHDLRSYAHQQYRRVRDGDPNDKNARAAYLEEQNKLLRKQLRVARERSASRLAKLQQATKTKLVETEQPQTAPAQLRLVG